MNHHLLADFRVHNGELLHRLMIDSVALLLQPKLFTLQAGAQGGMRVRARAGPSSFRWEGTLAAAQAEIPAKLPKN